MDLAHKGASSWERIVVADDDPTTLLLLSSALEAEGYRVETYSDGEAALASLRRSPPALALLDVEMPKLDGLRVLAEIRSTFDQLQLPVIICTAGSGDDTTIAALDCGANDYLVKPISARSLVARVKLHLRVSKLSATLAAREQRDAIAAMIVTYNHEINNPLAIALMSLSLLCKRVTLNAEDRELVEKSTDAMRRIKEIVLQIRTASTETLEFTRYAGDTRMVVLPLADLKKAT